MAAVFAGALGRLVKHKVRAEGFAVHANFILMTKARRHCRKSPIGALR